MVEVLWLIVYVQSISPSLYQLGQTQRATEDRTDNEDGLDDHKDITKSTVGWNIAEWSSADLQYFLCFKSTERCDD